MKTWEVWKVGYTYTRLGEKKLKDPPKVNDIVKLGGRKWKVNGWDGRKLLVV